MCRYADEFRQLHAEVVVVSFGTPALARRWLEETCSPFTMLLDAEREVYRAYGLKSSWLASWNPNTAFFYIRMLLSGRRLYGIQGDPNQLGGDFIIDTSGILRLSHPSTEATDRPPVPQIMDVLRRLHEQRASETVERG